MQSALSLRRPASLCRRGVSAGARQARPLALRVNAIAVGDMLPSFELQTDDKSFLKSQVRNTGPEGFSVQDALHARDQQSVIALCTTWHACTHHSMRGA